MNPRSYASPARQPEAAPHPPTTPQPEAARYSRTPQPEAAPRPECARRPRTAPPPAGRPVRRATAGTGLTARLARIAAVVAGLIVVLLGTAVPASAHAALVSTDPAQGSVVPTAPQRIVLTFSEGVLLSSDSLRVLDPRGAEVTVGTPTHANVPDSGSSATVALKPGLGNGTYTVAWRAISQDSHPVSGAFTFSIGAASKTAVDVSGVAHAGGGTATILYGVGRWFAYAGFALLVGTSIFLAVCWPRGAKHRTLQRLATGGWATITAATIALIMLRGPYADGKGLGEAFDLSVMRASLETRPGAALLSRLLLLAAAAVFLAVLFGSYARREDPEERADLAWGLAIGGTVVAVGIAATWAMAEHASVGIQRRIAMPVDVVHLIAMATWLGSLVTLLTALWAPSMARAKIPAFAVRRFSAIAFAAMSLLVASGVYQAWRQIGTWRAFTGTPYGRLLLVKIALVCVLLGLAWFSRRWTAALGTAPAAATGAGRTKAAENASGKAGGKARKAGGKAGAAAKRSGTGGKGAGAGGKSAGRGRTKPGRVTANGAAATAPAAGHAATGPQAGPLAVTAGAAPGTLTGVGTEAGTRTGAGAGTGTATASADATARAGSAETTAAAGTAAARTAAAAAGSDTGGTAGGTAGSTAGGAKGGGPAAAPVQPAASGPAAGSGRPGRNTAKSVSAGRAQQLRRQEAARTAATVRKSLAADPARAALRRSVLAETGVAVVLLAVTTILSGSQPGRAAEEQKALGATPPASAVPVSPPSVTVPYDTGGVNGKGAVTVSMSPGRAGTPNELHLELAGPDDLPVDAPEVRVAFTLPAQHLGPIQVRLIKLGAGHYAATGVVLPLPGAWQMAVTVRTSDIDEATMTRSVRIGS